MHSGSTVSVISNNSREHLVGVESKKKRTIQELLRERSRLEKGLLAGIIFLTLIGVALLIAILIPVFKDLLNKVKFKNIRENRRQPVLCESPECIQSAAMLLQNMDTSADPCQDFYKYACGNWADSHIVVDGSNSWFIERTKYIQSKVLEILQENNIKTDPEPLNNAKTLYKSCVDTEQLDKLGIEPLFQVLDNVSLPRTTPSADTTSSFKLARTLALAQRVLSMDILVTISLDTDNETNITTMHVSPGLGFSSLPELNLVSTDLKVAKIDSREVLLVKMAYVAGVLAELNPTGNASAFSTAAFKILLMESQLKSDTDQVNGDEEPQKMTFGELQQLMDEANSTGDPNNRLDWNEYLDVLLKNLNTSADLSTTVYVHGLPYFIALARRLHKVKPESIQRLIWWKIVDAVLPHTTSAMRQLREDLLRTLFRMSGRPSRPSRCSRIIKSFLNMAISYKMASENPLLHTTEKVRRMLIDINDAFKSLVAEVHWMDKDTKEATLDKIDSIRSYIGYPEWLLKPGELEEFYMGAEIKEGEFLHSMLNIKAVEVSTLLSTLGTVPETKAKYSWVSDPIEVNAYYSRNLNAISIPAGILQIPFYFLGLEALNYGAIGSILGHEVTHGFDIEGKDFDAKGRKVSWWSPQMLKEYNKRAQCFILQYNNYTLQSHNLNGTQTLAENIADNGGVREALRGYRSYVKRHGPEKPLPGLQHLTHEQLLYLGFANVWCQSSTPESDALTLGDVHSPSRYRVIGSLSNSPEFSQIWNCPANSPMNPKSKCILW